MDMPPLLHITTNPIDGTEYVAVPMEWVQWVIENMNVCIQLHAVPNETDVMQAAADAMRDNAGERFPELGQIQTGGKWYDADGDEVIFTPYGYRKLNDVRDEIRAAERKTP